MFQIGFGFTSMLVRNISVECEPIRSEVTKPYRYKALFHLMLVAGYWILDAGCWILDAGYLMLDAEY